VLGAHAVGAVGIQDSGTGGGGGDADAIGIAFALGDFDGDGKPSSFVVSISDVIFSSIISPLSQVLPHMPSPQVTVPTQAIIMN